MPHPAQLQGQIQYTITPWRYPRDLLAVRNNLYTPSSPEDQAQAIATVAAWKLRGNVPHAVESTALLFDAMLFHARSTGSLPSATPSSSSFPVSHVANSFALRAAYTTALSRFVTGFADLGRHKGGIGQSMFDVARTIALPPHFVELRHEVAHEEMPGLARLVRSSREAVQWLWGVYWSRLEQDSTALGEASLPSHEGKQETHPNLELTEVRGRAGTLLKEFRSQRLARLKSGKGKKVAKEQVKTVSAECARLCYGENNRDRWEEVVGVLVDEGLIIPSLKQSGPLSDAALGGAYILWDELLLQFASKSECFAELLLEKGVARVSAFTTTDGDVDDSDASKWAIYRWMMHLLYSEEWREARRNSGGDWKDLIIQECSLYPNSRWSIKIADELQEESRGHGADEEADHPDREPADDTVLETAVGVAEQCHKGWRRPSGVWQPLPFGVVGS